MYTANTVRSESLRLAALTGYDPRTCAKALIQGVEAIHSRKIREDLRPHVEAWIAAQKEAST